MARKELIRVKTISEFHKLKGLTKPNHPLIRVIDYGAIECISEINAKNWVFDFYHISIKRGLNAKLKYGQQQYDFDDGVMFFISPNQVFGIEPLPESTEKRSGWMLLIHPDFFWKTTLAQNIRKYIFFDAAIYKLGLIFLMKIFHHIAVFNRPQPGYIPVIPIYPGFGFFSFQVNFYQCSAV